MSIFGDLYHAAKGDNGPVLESKNPDIQRMIEIMNDTYGVFIYGEYFDGKLKYRIKCISQEYNDYLFEMGLYHGGSVLHAPSGQAFFSTKTQAYNDGLLAFHELLEEYRASKETDAAWF